MKLFKYFLLLFSLFMLAFVVFVATQPTTYKITRLKEIKASNTTVFEFVNDFKNWYDWQQFGIDNKTKFTFSKNTVGKKAFVSWESNKKLLTNFAEKDSISQDFIDGSNKQKLIWKFKKTKSGGTLVMATISGNLTFKEKVYSVLNGGISSYITPQIVASLNKLENYLVKELGNYKVNVIGLVNMPEINFIEQKDSCLSKDFPKKSKIVLKSIKTFIKNNQIETLGKPFVIFYKNPVGNTMIYSMCISVKDQILTTPESQIQGNTYKSYLALKTVLYGDYTHIKHAYTKARAFIFKNKYRENFNLTYLGIYKKATPEVNEPSKWETEIYIPIEKKKPIIRRKIISDSTLVETPKS